MLESFIGALLILYSDLTSFRARCTDFDNLFVCRSHSWALGVHGFKQNGSNAIHFEVSAISKKKWFLAGNCILFQRYNICFCFSSFHSFSSSFPFLLCFLLNFLSYGTYGTLDSASSSTVERQFAPCCYKKRLILKLI